MKPNWKNAPKWANYLAVDYDGTWAWYEEKPEALVETGYWITEGDYVNALTTTTDWQRSLESRPQENCV